MGYARKDVEKTKKIAKKFVRYQEGAELYSIGLTKFQELAKEAKAVYKIDKVALVNCEIFEKYLETFRIAQGTEENRGRTKNRKTKVGKCKKEILIAEETGKCYSYHRQWSFLSSVVSCGNLTITDYGK